MKIGPIDLTNTRSTTATGERAAARPSGTAAAEPSAQVALSPAAASLLAGQDPGFDAAKVARISQAIRDGSFRINAGAIADKLLANTQEVLARSQH